jgi:hypothetical protein
MARGQIRMKAYIPERKYELASIYFVLGRKASINNRMYKSSGKTGLQSAFKNKNIGILEIVVNMQMPPPPNNNIK